MGRPKGSKSKIDELNVDVVDKPVETVDIPVKVAPKVARVRQVSTNKDHKGEGEPLCFGCGHRSDMHYIEHRWVEQRFGKNLQGDFLTVDVHHRKPNYDGPRPCQHACLCKAYE